MHALPPIGHADLHIHPSGNAASATTPMTIYAALLASDLQVAVLTDHNRVDVARELVARSRDEGIPMNLWSARRSPPAMATCSGGSA
jgi:predicted metal-dependent phosphoesterase TrpH